MAKTGFWLRGSNGKLAGATIYQQNGETVMREVVTPTNPKTEKQIIQRIIMHTVMQAYSKMKDICDHSFEGLKKGQPTMSYFMSQNVGFAREKVASMQGQGILFDNMYNFVPLGLKGFTPNQYQVSMGSLPRVDCNLREEDEGKAFVPVIRENTYAAVINALGLQGGGTSGDTPSGGGSNANAPAVQSAQVDGNSMTMGTTKVVSYAQGTEWPLTKSVGVTVNEAAEGSYLSIRANGAEVASTPISNEGPVNVSHAWAKDTVYSIHIVDENDQIVNNTGYSFKLTESSGDGPGGFEE